MQSLSKKLMTFCAVWWSRLQSISSSSVACDTLDTVLRPSWSTKHSFQMLRKENTVCIISSMIIILIKSLTRILWPAQCFIFPYDCQGRLLSSRVLIVRDSWAENKFPSGMVGGSDMVWGVVRAQYPCTSWFSFFPHIRNHDSSPINLVP